MVKVKKIIIDSMHGRNISITNNMDKLNAIINTCHVFFPNANINPNTNTLQLSGNINNQGNIIIDGNRVFLDVQDPISVELLYKLYIDVIKILTENFGIDTFNRVGIRCFMGQEIKNPKLIDSLIINKFMKPNVNESNKYGKDMKDIRIAFTTKYNHYKINHNFAKLSTQNVNINPENVETIIKSFNLYDIDFYKDSQTNISDINVVFDDASKQINILSKEYFSSIGGE